MARASTGIILVLVSAVAFGLMPIMARFAYANGVGVVELLFVRFLFGFMLMGAILLASGRLILPGRTDLLKLILLGAFAYGLQSGLYFTALLYSPIAIVALVLYTYPVFTTIGAFVLGWERISKPLAAALVIALAGLVLVANPSGEQLGLGVILALGASIIYTIYILGGSKVLRRVRGDVGAFYVMGAASVSFGVAGEFTKTIHLNFGLMGWFWVAMLTLVGSILGLPLFFMGLSKIGPSRASLISLIEPLTSVFASLALFGNSLTASQWFGGLLILIATAITALYSRPEPLAQSIIT